MGSMFRAEPLKLQEENETWMSTVGFKSLGKSQEDDDKEGQGEEHHDACGDRVVASPKDA